MIDIQVSVDCLGPYAYHPDRPLSLRGVPDAPADTRHPELDLDSAHLGRKIAAA